MKKTKEIKYFIYFIFLVVIGTLLSFGENYFIFENFIKKPLNDNKGKIEKILTINSFLTFYTNDKNKETEIKKLGYIFDGKIFTITNISNSENMQGNFFSFCDIDSINDSMKDMCLGYFKVVPITEFGCDKIKKVDNDMLKIIEKEYGHKVAEYSKSKKYVCISIEKDKERPVFFKFRLKDEKLFIEFY
jgi:hypothetical protein